eukprot:gene12911-14901_t
MEVPIELCNSAKVYRKDPVRRSILGAILLALYAISIPYCINTAGHPRRDAMIQAQKLADEHWARESQTIADSASNATFVEFEPEVEVEAFKTSMVDITGAGLSSQSGSSARDDFDDEEEVNYDVATKKAGFNPVAYVSSFFTTSKESKRAKADFDKWQKEFKEKSGETVSLPPEYLPSAWACLSLFATLTIHALFYLLGHWIVSFKALSLFKPANKVEDGCFVLITPPPNRGSPALVPVVVAGASARNKTTTANKDAPLQVNFQRQNYNYLPANKLGEAAKKFPHGVFSLAAYPIALPIEHYLEATGLKSDAEIEKQVTQWGKNHLAVAIPGFLELLQLQLLSPLAIFQVFCALLWLLDEYWSYTLFTLCSVVAYEATTVFQRTRTQKMLGGMAAAASPIYVYRCNTWKVTTTKELLPGDIISLAFKKRSNKKVPVKVAPPAIANTAAGAEGAVTAGANPTATPEAAEDPTTKAAAYTSRDEIVPCDCVLLRGKAVVNEASLTGESVPQMKESLTFAAGGNATGGASTNSLEDLADSASNSVDKLDMNGLNRVNVLFSGCSFVTVDGLNKESTKLQTSASGANLSGTSTPVPTAAGAAGIPCAPDGGALAYVLRTGFGSSQGSLLQMIEFSQQSVAGDSKETGMALLLLFIFAIFASGYVLKEGLRKKEKTTHELLLKCVIIITSVVPRQLPMQMAMAVNMALMALTKAGIFCTEPFRVPLAGKVSHCLFDKTGTLTTDQLVPVGIINHNSAHRAVVSAGSSDVDTSAATAPALQPLPKLGEVITATAETAIILAACHSLVVVEDADAAPASAGPSAADNNNVSAAEKAAMAASAANANLVGDPIELAAIKGIDWSWDAATSTASPTGGVHRCTMALALAQQQLKQLQQLGPNHDTKIANIQKDIPILEQKLKDAQYKAASAIYSGVQVLQRHHFSSKLQRMSVVCKCENTGKNGTKEESWYCLVKGSPEALKHLMVPSSIPTWYTQSYESLARRGLRVLALAYKKVDRSVTPRPLDQPRSWVESGLHFGGFIAFECKIRADSGVVMSALIQSDHKVSMLTGDALLTSLHVAKKVNICSDKLPCATLTVVGAVDPLTSGTSSTSSHASSVSASVIHVWTVYDEKTGVETTMPFDVQNEAVTKLGLKYNLLTTEEAFLSAANATGGKTSPLWAQADAFKVFARMSPQGKANIIRAIQDNNKDSHVFMCGDGGNDVGALKQADIGLALLAGHANANTTEDIVNSDTAAGAKGQKVGLIGDAESSTSNANTNTDVSAEDALNSHAKKMSLRNEAFNKARTAHMKAFQAQFTKDQQIVVQEEIKKKTEAGDFMGMFTVMKNQANVIKMAMQEENQRYMAMHGQVWDPKKDGDGLGGEGSSKTGIEKMMESMESGDAGGLPMVRPGDASVAAPFTSRIPSVRAVVDLIRQGRCTLLSALMQQQIMMLESCIAAYTLSALSLHNARSSERQMMASSWLIMTAAVSFSYASPLDHMHPLRPLRSLFHPAIIISTLGQALIHIACMTLAVKWATEAMGPEALKEVTEFFRKAKANEIARDAHCGEDDFMCQMQSYWTAPFLPNLLNTVVFLVETSQMISVFFANYKGRPWMKGMLENHPLFLSVFACIGGVIVAAWEFVPQLNEMIQLAPFPDDYFRYKVVVLVASTILG